MKKILLALFFSVACFLSYGQVGVMGGGVAEAGGETTWEDVLNDGYTEARWIASSSYITEDVGVTTWADSTANDNDLTQTTDAQEPAFSGDSIYFDGAADNISLDFAVTSDTIEQPFTMYFVWSRYSNDSTLISSDGSVNRIYLNGDNETWNTWGNFMFENVTTIWPVNTWGIYKVIVDGSGANTSEIQVNDETAETGDLGDNDLTSFQISGHSGTSQVAEISVREIIIRSTDDGGGDDDIIVSYLNTKYSIY